MIFYIYAFLCEQISCRISRIKILLFICCFSYVFSFKISIDKCLTVDGEAGICRPKEQCFAKIKTDVGSCKQTKYVCCPTSGKSHRNCLKYAEAVYQSSDSEIVISVKRKTKKVSQCGISMVPLIIGGEKVKSKEFPHMALIGYGKTQQTRAWMCGGSLISPNYVLTAAHCLDGGSKGPARWVRLGILNMKNLSNALGAQEIEVEKRIFHPHYKLKMNDIALLKLKTNANITQYVRPACLDDTGLIKEKSAIATGWGRTSFDSVEQNEYLLKVQLDIIDKSTCSAVFQPSLYMPNGLEDSMMCAGVLSGGKDTCNGDSGGPLQTFSDIYCMYRIIGVTSNGKFCGFANSPAIYSRVFSFIPWIESIVWP
uniref:Peptidase S1 domain-containing protein n=2 Tax=Clastoptera arizonana TaxID=38151 RepID=A0A1B6D4D7_9HEMI